MKSIKFIPMFMVLVLILASFCNISSFAISYDYEATLDGDYTVTEDGWWVKHIPYYEVDYIEIVGYSGGLKSITIPKEIDGIEVKNVIIQGNKTIESVIVPENENLSIVNFAWCSNLKSASVLGLKYLEDGIFAGCTNLENVEVSDELISIGVDAFLCCYKLSEFTIPDTVTSIGEYAFSLTALKSVVIPKNCTQFGSDVFSGCKELEKIEFLGNKVNFFEKHEDLMGYYTEEKNNIIPSHFASNCTSLKSINIPESVKSIGASAFENCTSLKSITILKNVKTVYRDAFKSCENLTSVKFAGAVNNIGKSAFSKCVNLKTVNFTKGYLKKVYDYAFYKCEKLEKITISNTKNVPSIHKSAFNKAKSGIKFYVKNNTVAKKLKSKLQKTNIKKAKIYRSAPILIYKNVG